MAIETIMESFPYLQRARYSFRVLYYGSGNFLVFHSIASMFHVQADRDRHLDCFIMWFGRPEHSEMSVGERGVRCVRDTTCAALPQAEILNFLEIPDGSRSYNGAITWPTEP